MEHKIIVADSLGNLPENPWMENTRQFEKSFAVKWYAIFTYVGDEIAGFMHIFRNPDDVGQWYFCDVHTKQEYRKQHFATRMYQKAFDIIKEYEKAYCIMASIHPDNVASIKLHENMGFCNSNQRPVFADFIFEPEETMYYYHFATAFPTVNNEMSRQQLKPMWEAYIREIGETGTSEEIESAMKVRLEVASQNEIIFFDRIWAGDNLIGFVFYSVDGGIHNLIPAGYGYIMEFYILPEWRNQRFGMCIANYVIEKLKGEGCPKIYLTSTIKSRQFWKKLGFYESGILDPDNHLEIYFHD